MTTRINRIPFVALAWVMGLLLLNSFAAHADDKDYRIGAGDVIRVSVFGYQDLTSEVRVSQSGNITYPLIGEVKVSDLSTGDAENLISRRLSDGSFIKQPHVTVLVLQFQSQQVSVMGQVNKPGQYPLDHDSHVIDLLAAAGGVESALGGDNATLLRKDGTKVAIDLHALFQGDPSLNLRIYGGDTLYVPRAPQFYVYGEVQRPGVYRLERNMTVSQAITAGGGLTPRGTERHPTLRRRDADGKLVESKVDGGDLLQADDILYVKESWF